MGSTCSSMQPVSAPSTPETSLNGNPVLAMTVKSNQAAERPRAAQVESYPLSAVPQNNEKRTIPATPPVPRYQSYSSEVVSPTAQDDSSPGCGSQLTEKQLRALVQAAWTASESNAL